MIEIMKMYSRGCPHYLDICTMKTRKIYGDAFIFQMEVHKFEVIKSTAMNKRGREVKSVKDDPRIVAAETMVKKKLKQDQTLPARCRRCDKPCAAHGPYITFCEDHRCKSTVWHYYKDLGYDDDDAEYHSDDREEYDSVDPRYDPSNFEYCPY